MLNISNLSKSIFVKQKPNSKAESNLKSKLQSQLILDQKDSQDLEDGFGNNFLDFITLMLTAKLYL